MGKLILTSGFPKLDPFSYTMPSYPYVDYEWLSDVFIAFLLPLIGKIGLSLVFSFFAIFPLFIFFRNAKKLELVPLFLSVSILLPFFGIRPQIITWFFFSILVTILFDEKLFKRFSFVIPILFLVWSNFHAGFVAGLTLLGIVCILRFFKSHFDFRYLLILFSSFAITFINPYGFKIWPEIWNSYSSVILKFTIQEWLPAIFTMNFGMVSYVPFSVLLIYRYRKRFNLEELIPFAVFFIQALIAVRHLPLWLILSFPLIKKAISEFQKETVILKINAKRLITFNKVAIILALGIASFESVYTLWRSFGLSEKSFYPAKAIGYLKTFPNKGKVFSEYGWGGYLIWKMPEKKVFIDGRMNYWINENAPKNESKNAFDDFNQILSGKINFEEISQNYNIDTVLWPSPKKKSYLDILSEKFLHKKDFDFGKSLTRNGWIVTYQDEVSTVYRKLVL